MQYHRVDDLGRETVFHVLPKLMRYEARRDFERLLTRFALGYTRSDADGGWKGEKEYVLVYRVATLPDDLVQECIAFLLHNSDMQDVYVVHADGVARGHCLEEAAVGKYESIPAPWENRPALRPYKGVPDRNAPQLDPHAPKD